MVHSKEEVLSWFRHQPAPLRIETLCALLECCLPFELRFAGTVLENLGKRDFHDLRDAEQRANRCMTSTSSPEENRTLLLQSLLTDVPSVPSNGGITHQHIPNLSQHHPRNSPATLADKNNRINSKVRQQSIPNSNLVDSKTSAWVNDGNASTGNPSKPTTNPNMPLNGINTKLIENHLILDPTSSHNSGDSEDDADSDGSGGDQSVLLSVHIRRRMILYLSLLQTSNRDGANTFYELMDPSEIHQMGGFDRLLPDTLGELALLYTIGFYHPAFTFNQHFVLSEILMQIKLSIYRKELGSYSGTFYAQTYDQKTGQMYVYQIAPQSLTPAHLLQIQAQQQQMQAMHHHHSQAISPATAPTPQLAGVGSAQQATVQNTTGVTPSITQEKPAIVDTTRGSNQPYVYPPNFPSFMSQSPPSNNTATHPGVYFGNPQMSPYTSTQTPLHHVPVMSVPVPPVTNNSGMSEKWNTRSREKESRSPSINGDTSQVADHFQYVNRPRNMSCFNCGSQSHFGHECKEQSMEAMTRHLYRLNFNSKAESS